MTGPVTTEALVERLRKSLAMAANDPGNVIRADGTSVGYKGDRCMGGWIADAIIAGPLVPLLASLQQVTAERDKYRDGEEISDVMAQVGFDRMMEVCKERDTANAEAASLRAEVEALKEDAARLDFLDGCNARLNASYGTHYGWKLVLNHNVNRLVLGDMKVDLHDSEGGNDKLPSCRLAIDEARKRAALARAATAREGQAG